MLFGYGICNIRRRLRDRAGNFLSRIGTGKNSGYNFKVRERGGYLAGIIEIEAGGLENCNAVFNIINGG